MDFYRNIEFEQVKDATIGGKAKNLFRLNEIGLLVPTFIVIPAEFLKEKVLSGHSEKAIEEINGFQFPEESIALVRRIFPG